MNWSAQMSLTAPQHEAECGAWRAGTQAGSPPRDSPSPVTSLASCLKGAMAVETPALLQARILAWVAVSYSRGPS